MRFERVLVTGGSGRLGRFVVDELAGRCAVAVLDLKPPAQDVVYHQADILDRAAVSRAVAGQEAIVHLAGYDDGDAPDEAAYIGTNVDGAWNVFEAAAAAGVRQIVVAASTAALGLGRCHPPDYLPVDEAHPLRPRDAYGLSKQVIETTARYFASRGRFRAVCLRPTLIVRPEREAAIVAQLALPDPDADPPDDRPAEAAGVRPYGALSATRTYVRSADAARAFRLALDYEDADFDVFNVAAGDGIGREETLARLMRIWGRLPELRDRERWARDPYASALDAGRARERLGWEATGDWRAVAER